MKPLVIIGLVLIILGVGALAYQGFTYTSREKLIDFGIFQASAETKKTIPLPPIAGAAAIVCGAVMVVLGRRKS